MRTNLSWHYHPTINTFFADYISRDSARGIFGGWPRLRNVKGLQEWCEEHNCNINENWIECPNEEVATMFKLTWI